MHMIDAFDNRSADLYRALAGGVTTELLLHGSANMIGGQAVVIKNKFGLDRDAMLFPDAPRLDQVRLAARIPSASTAAAINCLRRAWVISK